MYELTLKFQTITALRETAFMLEKGTLSEGASLSDTNDIERQETLSITPEPQAPKAAKKKTTKKKTSKKTQAKKAVDAGMESVMEPAPLSAEPDHEPPKYIPTFEELKAKIIEWAGTDADQPQKVRELLKDFGVAKLSDMDDDMKADAYINVDHLIEQRRKYLGNDV